MKRKFGTLWIILIILFACVFCYSGYRLASELILAKNEKNAFAELAEQKRQAASASQSATLDVSGNQHQTEKPVEEAPTEPYEPDEEEDSEPSEPQPLAEYLPFYEMNPDYFGWLTIEGTEVDYPVVYTPDRPEYYLRRAFDGSDSRSGVPFLDANCSGEGNYYLIYSHNMKNKSMFGQLTYYLDASFAKEHPLIQFDTLYEKHTYEVMAVFLSKVYYVDEDYQNAFLYYEYYDLPNEEVFNKYMAQVRRAALYDTGVEAEYGDSVLVLSTCNYHTEDGRLVVVAIEHRPEEDEGEP